MGVVVNRLQARLLVAVLAVVALLAASVPMAAAAPKPKTGRGFTIGPAQVTEGDTGTKLLVFTVTLNGSTTKTSTVRYSTAGRTASAPTDFAPASGLLTFPKGVSTRQVGISVFGDLIDEVDETVVVSLSGATRTKILTAQGIGTIVDDDPTPVVSVEAVSAPEGNGTANTTMAFPVRLDRPSGSTVTVRYSTSQTGASPATAGADYTTVSSGQLTFQPGQTFVVAPVVVLADAQAEPDETLRVTLSSPNNAVLAPTPSAVGTIVDNDTSTPPAVSIADAGDAEGGTVTFVVSISPAAPSAFQLAYDVLADTATSPADFAGNSGTIAVPANATQVTLDVPTTQDALHEAAERFFVNVRPGTPSGGATVTDGQAVGTITDDDPAPSVTVGDTDVSEGDDPATPNFAYFPVSLSGASGLPVTVHFATTAGTALAGTHYQATSGDLTFYPGETEQTVPVAIIGNPDDNPDRTFGLSLSSATGATITDGTATATIVDDEAALQPSISVDDPTITEGDAATSVLPFTVQLSDFSDDVVTVQYVVTGPTGPLPSGTLTFDPGETADVVGVNVPGNTTPNGPATYTLTLSNPSATATLAAHHVGTGTVVDNDAASPDNRVSVADAAVVEGDSSPTVLQFVVTLMQPAAGPLTVDYATAGLTATPGEDFAPAADTLHFVAGQQSKVVLVVVPSDLETEGDETLLLNLTNPSSGLVIGDGQAIGTIKDDDPAGTALTLSVGDDVVREAAPNVTAHFAVTLSAVAPTGGVPFQWSVVNSSTNDADFQGATSGSGVVAAGSQTATIPVTIAADDPSLGEPTTEQFFVDITTTAPNVALGRGRGVGTIIDGQVALPQASLGDVTVHNGAVDGTVVVTIPVSIDHSSSQPISIDYSIPSPTGGDPITGTITIDPGQTTGSATRTVPGDVEDVASSLVTITDATGAVLNPDAASATPRVVPVVNLGPVEVTEGTTPGTSIVDVTVTTDEPVAEDVTVVVSIPSTTGGAPTTITIVIPAGETSGHGTETVQGTPVEVAGSPVTITDVSGGGVVSSSSVTPTVVDVPVVQIVDVVVNRGTTPGTSIVEVTVTIDEPSDVDVTVEFTVPGTPPVVGTITIPAGSTSASGSVSVPGDPADVAGSDVTLTDASGAIIDPAHDSAPATEVDLPIVTIDDVVVNPGPTEGTSIVVVTVTVDEAPTPATGPITVEFTVPPAVPGGEPTTGTITIPVGSTTGSGSVVVPGDPADVAGSDVTLTGGDGAVLDPSGSSQPPAPIDLPVVQIGDVVVNPGTTPGTSIVQVTVTIDEPSDTDVTVEFTVPGSPPVVGTVTIPAGSTSATGSVTVPGAPGTVAGTTVTLTDASGAVIDPSHAGGPATQVDLPVVTIDDVVVNPGSSDGTSIVVVTVTIDEPSPTPVTVEFTVPPAVDGGAPTTGTITIPAGSTTGTGSVVVPGDPSDVSGSDVTLTDADGAVLDPSGSGQPPTPTDLPVVTIGDVTVSPGTAPGTVVVTIPVTIDQPSSVPVTVDYSIPPASGSGSPTTGTITIPPGSTGGTATVTVPGNTTTEVPGPVTITNSTGSVIDPGDSRDQPSVVAGPGTSGGGSGGSTGSAGSAGSTAAAGGAAQVVDHFTRVATGYRMVASDGGIFTFGDAPFFGSTGNLKLNQPIVGMATTPSGDGYWLVASDGGIFAFGDAQFFGSTGNLKLNKPIVGMETTPTGNGYWLVATDGGIFAFGDAQFFGSTGDLKLNQPIVGMEVTPSGNGYWLAARDGGMFTFGDAGFFGSTGDIRLNQPIVGMAASPSGNGYRLVATDGGIFAFGDASFLGSTGAIKLNKPIVGMAVTPSGNGYWLAATDGGIFTFGDAQFLGSTGDLRLNQPINGMAPVVRTIRIG